ncbi:neural cell adhesion molecule L1 isoform X3 [Paramuricea clavata]|uniref:Neural cell adhesion molecule L1 isoform X3 n=1 Tax=Paramuricea clavata TaxID=317549 RepID=A0A6S7J4P2_PARCT|nr:neural cell adhesion molecule L1 isoform X3 [Paramuricea clavata]
MLLLQSPKYRLSGLNPNTQYNISLKAYNSQGNGPPKYFTFQTASLTLSKKSGSPVYKQNWFITIISIIVLLMFIVVFIIFVLNIRRSDRYLVGKRERKKGGFLNLDDKQYDPEPDISPSEEKRASLKSSWRVSSGPLEIL